MVAKRRSWWQKIKWLPIIVVGIIVVILLTAFAIAVIKGLAKTKSSQR